MGLSILLLIMSVFIGIFIDNSSIITVGFAQCIILSLLWFAPYKEKLRMAVKCRDIIVAMDCSMDCPISLKGIFEGIFEGIFADMFSSVDSQIQNCAKE